MEQPFSIAAPWHHPAQPDAAQYSKRDTANPHPHTTQHPDTPQLCVLCVCVLKGGLAGYKGRTALQTPACGNSAAVKQCLTTSPPCLQRADGGFFPYNAFYNMFLSFAGEVAAEPATWGGRVAVIIQVSHRP